eukprot:3941940-Rhodomonas_salina.3
MPRTEIAYAAGICAVSGTEVACAGVSARLCWKAQHPHQGARACYAMCCTDIATVLCSVRY